MLKLYYAPGACSLASHIALEETGGSYQTERVDFASGQQRTPEYLRVNPKGRVPALVTDKGTLTESPVILGYIAQTFPDAKLAPNGDSFAFGDVQAFNMFIATSVHISFAHIFRPTRYGEESAAEGMRAKALESLGEYFGMIERKLGDNPWVHGAAFTISDPYLLVMSRWADRVGLDLSATPAVVAHRERVTGRPAVQRVLAAEAA